VEKENGVLKTCIVRLQNEIMYAMDQDSNRSLIFGTSGKLRALQF
jgi:hypothetical protein